MWWFARASSRCLARTSRSVSALEINGPRLSTLGSSPRRSCTADRTLIGWLIPPGQGTVQGGKMGSTQLALGEGNSTLAGLMKVPRTAHLVHTALRVISPGCKFIIIRASLTWLGQALSHVVPCRARTCGPSRNTSPLETPASSRRFAG